jgi:hypothetical protein
MVEGGSGRGIPGDRGRRDRVAARQRQAGPGRSGVLRGTDVRAERFRGSVVDTAAYRWACFAIAAAFTVAAVLTLYFQG